MNENIIKINYQNKNIYLVKTAHVSKTSIEDVRSICEEVKPDTICIELDQERYDSLANKSSWQNTDIFQIIKDKKIGYFMANCILSSFQRRMAKSMDTNTGGEMIEGIKIAKENNLELVLADRPIKTTFSRIWSKLGFFEKCKLIATIIVSLFDNEEISEEELATLKESDSLDAALQEVSKQFPTVKEVLVDERDKYLADKIKKAKGNNIVAIIGAAHSLGIQKYINDEYNIKDFEVIEKKTSLVTILKWTIPLFIIFMIVYTLIVNSNMALGQIKSWILWNGGMCALGTLIAFGHPLTILTGFIAAPITSLNPLLGAGFFTAFVEAYIRKPQVKDFQDISNDTLTIKGFWKNKVTRIFLIFFLSSIFSSIATFISGSDIARDFFNLFS